MRLEFGGHDWLHLDEQTDWFDTLVPDSYLLWVDLVDEGRVRLYTFPKAWAQRRDVDWAEWCHCRRLVDAGVITIAVYVDIRQVPTSIIAGLHPPRDGQW